MGRKKATPVEFTEPQKKKVGRPPKVEVDGEAPRGRGRPSKDEVVVKPIVVHTRGDIKPENQLKYAKETVRRAENIYKHYNEQRPNPLNIDILDLCNEAREAWKFVFSSRGYTGEECSNLAERVVRDEDEYLYLFECFCDYIRKNMFVQRFTRPDGDIGVLPIVPNQTSFARWLGISRRTLIRAMRENSSEEAFKEYKTMLGDLLSEGAMMGIYQTTMSIFSLKNLCDWADKYEDRPQDKSDTTQTVEEAKALMESLGYLKLGDGHE